MLGFPLATAILIQNNLGYSTAAALYGIAPSGDNFVLEDLECTGNETSVFDCPHNGEWIEDCDATDIAGVQCATSKL